MRKKLVPAALAAISAVIAFIMFFFGIVPVSAETVPTEWYRVEKQSVPFYKSPADTADNVLFFLEYTYFVKPLSAEGAFFEVQLYENKNGFVKMTGYVRAADLTKYAKTPAAPLYPEVSLTVTASTTLKQTPSNSGDDITAVLSGKTVAYYGKAATGDWYFIRVGDDFGYLPANRLSALAIPLHPTPLVEAPDPPVNTDPKKPDPPDGTGNPVLEIVLVLLICIPALIIVVLLFLPNKNIPTKKTRPDQPANRPKYLDDSAYFDDLDLI